MTIARCLRPALMACLLSATAQSSFGQVVYYQPMVGTALSADLFALAAAARAGGEVLVLDARARDIRAKAAKQELENYRIRVNNFWEVRRQYRSERDAAHPGYLDRQRKNQDAQRRKLREDLETGTDLTDELNFMLSGLLAAGAYSAFATDADFNSVLGSSENLPLSANEQRQVRLSEGNVAGGGLVFSLDPDQILDPHWTHALLDDRFQRARSAFDDARKLALSDLRKEQGIRKDNQDRLLKTVSDLVDEFKAVWPSARGMSPDEFYLSYRPAQKCLERLNKNTRRLITSNNPAAFDDSYRIKAETVADLLREMMNKGLEFGPPDPGGERVYKKLFISVRAFYRKLADAGA